MCVQKCNGNATTWKADGNQTIGEDYSFFKSNESNAINTVVLGDTTLYKDISVGPILTNKYAFLKNSTIVERDRDPSIDGETIPIAVCYLCGSL